MEITNSFAVKAPPDVVYAFLLDVNNVVGCVPGAELSEVVDPDTFKGKVRIKVGPVTVSYNGTARITSRDAATRTATLEADGKETTGSGSAQATTAMSVVADGDASTVTLTTDFTVVGRVAQFGRGIMEDVSRHLVGQAAECIQSKLEAPPAGTAPAPAAAANGTTATPTTASTPTPASTPSQPAALDAVALGRAVAKERLSRLKVNPQSIAIGLGALISFLLLRRWRRARRRRRAANG
ncbi:MAG TPA: SRPBCC family protein [Candidatus Acidoferrales bacterium]|nr:SRPBCC family protein [Candidatus Acidoferrales bacterium]